MAKPKDTRPHPGYGDLNRIQTPDMQIGYDPENTSFLGTVLKQASDRFKVDAFKGTSNFYGVCLRVDGSKNKSGSNILSLFSFGESVSLLEIKVRIPELHALLPEPDLFGNSPSGPHQHIIDLYPTFVAVSKEVSRDIPAVGDIVRVTFADRTNQSQGLYLGKYANGPGGAGEKNNNPFGIYTGRTDEGKSSFNTSNGLSGGGGLGGLGPEGVRSIPQVCGKPGNRGNTGYSPPKARKPTTGVFSKKKGDAPTMKSSTPTGNKILDRATVMSSRIKIASGVDVNIQLLMAFIMVESNGRAATRMLVRFEPHCFLGATRKRNWSRPDLKDKIPYTPRGTNPAPYISKTKTETNRAAFDRAYKLDPIAALRSTSFGAYQVMGVWLLKLFNNNPQQALKAYDKDPTKASDDMAVLWWANELKNQSQRDVERRGNFKKAIATQPHDFITIAHHYNGGGQKNKYGAKLKKYFEKFGANAAASVSSPAPTAPTPASNDSPTSTTGASATAAAATTTIPTAETAYTYWTNLVAKAGGKLLDGRIDTTLPTVIGIRGISYDSGGNFVKHDRTYQRSRNRGKDKGYKDFFIVIKDGAISGPFPGNTRPSFGFGKYGVDANKDGTKDVGMLRPGTYKAVWEGPHKKYGVTTWRVSRKDTGEQREMKNGKLIWSGARQRGKGWNLSDTWRDTGNNKSYIWTTEERNTAVARGDLSTAVLFHNGTKNNPNSAGCQTMFTSVFQQFQSQVGDTSFWYTLIADGGDVFIGDPII